LVTSQSTEEEIAEHGAEYSHYNIRSHKTVQEPQHDQAQYNKLVPTISHQFEELRVIIKQEQEHSFLDHRFKDPNKHTL